MKENNFEKIQEEFKTYIQNKEEVRIFVFKDKGNREHYSVLEFEEIISREYHEYFKGNVKVFVYDKYYVVVGGVTSTELRMVGKKICSHLPAGKLCKHYGKSTQLFRCVKRF